ncbi:MAG TPA: hypothetical protein VFE23_06310 [Usitatibacter sp.]|nr:hypothetical protein [Usitatibacter sp.]
MAQSPRGPAGEANKKPTESSQRQEKAGANTRDATGSPLGPLRASQGPADDIISHPSDKTPEERRVEIYSIVVTAAATTFLAVFTLVLIIVGWCQTMQLRRTVDISLIEAQPVLSPFVTNMDGLHVIVRDGTNIEIKGTETFTSRVFFAFENYGKTPAIIRQVRADLFLTLNDSIPNVVFDKLPIRFHQEIIPGETMGNDVLTRAAIDVSKEITVSSAELKELLAEAEGRWRRFFLVGQVIYDDFYNVRHTKRFCRKMRLADHIRFQAQHGGAAYNSIKREPIPKYDPLDTPA